MAKLLKIGLLCGVNAWVACGGGAKTAATSNDLNAQIPKVDPTLCDTAGKNVQTYDLNHDNRPDVWRLYKAEDEGGTKIEFLTCKQVDFDHDGRKDWVVAYNRKGTPLFQRADFDYDGKWDMYAIFDTKTGQVSEVERDTDFDGKFDVQEVYDTTGVLNSIRRDRNNDGQADLWEQYRDNSLIAILYDDDFDGKVDRREETPGARPKVEMPTTKDPTAAGNLNEPAQAGGSTATPPPDAKSPAPNAKSPAPNAKK